MKMKKKKRNENIVSRQQWNKYKHHELQHNIKGMRVKEIIK